MPSKKQDTPPVKPEPAVAVIPKSKENRVALLVVAFVLTAILGFLIGAQYGKNNSKSMRVKRGAIQMMEFDGPRDSQIYRLPQDR